MKHSQASVDSAIKLTDFEVEDLENRLEMKACIDLGGGWAFCVDITV
ncbi:MAG: hypothetical protein U0Z75_07285 [Deinococcaceae bacterium]